MCILTIDQALIDKVERYVEAYMSKHDASHDFQHVKRVVRNAHAIQALTPGTCRDLVTVAALLHDVGDRKYVRLGEESGTAVRDAVLELGGGGELADRVQEICAGVSYSAEMRGIREGQRNESQEEGEQGELGDLELAVVQDADRLDALGAVGVARAFAYGGAKGRTLEESVGHFDEKLLRLGGMMKTRAGREMARERTVRVRMMREWWREEADF